MKRGRPAYPDVLTPREWEVLTLIREGLTNEEIAARLGISERGARYHVSEILSKLGVSSRQEAARWRGDSLDRAPAVAATIRLGWAGGAMGRVAVVALATAAVGLVALALGAAVMSTRGDDEGASAPGANGGVEGTATPDPSRAEMIDLGEEAAAAAHAVDPNVFLHVLAYAGGSGLYTFLFTTSDERPQMSIVGPYDEPGMPRWQVNVEPFPAPFDPGPMPLDLASVQKSPAAVLQAAAAKAGAPDWSVGVELFVDPFTREIAWTAVAGPPAQTGGQGFGVGVPGNTAFIQCQVRDAADISAMTCRPLSGP